MSISQFVVTAVGLAAIVWVLWYFLLSKGSAPGALTVTGAQDVRRPSTSPHQLHE